jgi:hypothetical protein
MTVLETRLPDLDGLRLSRGSHKSWEQGACVMEAASYVAGEPWSDHPKCASRVITGFLVSWNDSLDDDARQMLKPLIPRLVGTRTSAKDETTRAWMSTDWLARECAPAFLRLAGLTEQAETLENLAPLTGRASAVKAQPSLDQARANAWAARDAAMDAAWAAWAARDAARAAAWAAGDAARAAARAAAWAAGDAAWAARDAAGAAAWSAGDAARAAAWVVALQASAVLLLDRMIEVGRKP